MIRLLVFAGAMTASQIRSKQTTRNDRQLLRDSTAHHQLSNLTVR